MSATLLALSAIGLVVPAMFHVHWELFHTKTAEQVLSLEIAIVLVAMKNRMELSYQIAVGSALQIALFVALVVLFAGYLGYLGALLAGS